MTRMMFGLTLALCFSYLSGGARAQCACATPSAGAWTGGPVVTETGWSQPVVAGGAAATMVGVVGQPVIAGQPMITETVGGGPIVTGTSGTVRNLPYSYYAAFPNRARIYVEYGATDQFPFHGRAYGNPGDRWSWYSMGGGSNRYLAKYYYPLLK